MSSTDGSTAAAWVTVAILAGSLLFAWWQVREARSLREAQTRPFVVVYFDPGFLIDLVITNFGPTIARDVRIQFEPELSSTMNDPDFAASTVFTEGIATLVPGQEFRFTFDTAPDRLARRDEFPLAYDIEISYSDHRSRPLRPERHRLDIGAFEGTRLKSAGLPEIHQALAKLGSEIKKWTDGIHGLMVVDRTEQVRAREEARERRRERSASGTSQANEPAGEHSDHGDD